jgi:hypothetical protein
LYAIVDRVSLLLIAPVHCTDAIVFVYVYVHVSVR